MKKLGHYPLEAFEFLGKGLDFTAQRIHGPLTPDLGQLLEWLETKGVGREDLRRLVHKGKLPPVILKLIENLGGLEATIQRPNRHVSGEELCWGLRDLATKQWGLMASVVLRHWSIRSTKDFGRMVFALVDNGLLQKEPEDTIADFNDVYNFDSAFDGSYKISTTQDLTTECDAE